MSFNHARRVCVSPPTTRCAARSRRRPATSQPDRPLRQQPRAVERAPRARLRHREYQTAVTRILGGLPHDVADSGRTMSRAPGTAFDTTSKELVAMRTTWS